MKFIALKAYCKEQEKSQIYNLTLHQKKVEEQISRKKEILKIRMETKQTLKRQWKRSN